jgi:stearoyl-CoA desaturase (delta-9 desaturase)
MSLGLYGIFYVPLQRETCWFMLGYFLFSIFGITAGYHRLWSHRSYRANYLLQLLLMLGGSSAVQGSCYWWARLHRSHHRYTDTGKDPYNSERGLFWTHIGWMMFRSDTYAGACDVSDLRSDSLVHWQHRRYLPIALFFGFVLPAALPGLLWGDWLGGLCYACALRMTVCHHSVFCINSIAHYLGDKPYDDRHSPCDNLASAILTMGEGYHNFHHQFPTDYRNAFHWYQYDPTKWFIAAFEVVGLTTQLRRFPTNQIHKSAFSMRLKALKREQDSLQWPASTDNLPIISWEHFQERSTARVLVLVSGFVHDVTDFVEFHPGGASLLSTNSGKDMTTAFFGGVYDHSNAAHDLLAMHRVAILAGGMEQVDDEQYITPSQRLTITESNAT